MKITPWVSFRPRQDSPTQEGWYFGRWRTNGQIMPYYVYINSDKEVVAITGGHTSRVTQLHWFGPVPEVREAS